jgi:outer membrane protein assembly factor BamB
VGKHLLILPIIFAALTAGCGNKAPSAPAPEASPAPLPANSFTQNWTAEVDSSAGAVVQIYLREDLLFAYTKNGQSYVINRQTGKLLHVDTIPGGIANVHPPLLTKDNIVYITLNTIEMFERARGSFIRTVRLPLAVRTGAVMDKGDIFLGANFPGGGRVVKLDATRQWVPIVWGLMFPNAPIDSAPAVFNDVVYAGASDGRVAAVSAESREAAWSFGFFETGGPIYADLQTDESGLYIASGDSKLYCLNRGSGKIKWQYFAGASLKAAPVLTSDLVYEFIDGTGLVALDKAPPVVEGKPSLQYDRQPRWIAPGATQILAADKSFTYAALADGSIAAIDKAAGKIAFTSKRNDFVAWCTNTKDGVVYAATSGNRVIAIVPVTTPGAVGTIVRADPPVQSIPQLARATN